MTSQQYNVKWLTGLLLLITDVRVMLIFFLPLPTWFFEGVCLQPLRSQACLQMLLIGSLETSCVRQQFNESRPKECLQFLNASNAMASFLTDTPTHTRSDSSGVQSFIATTGGDNRRTLSWPLPDPFTWWVKKISPSQPVRGFHLGGSCWFHSFSAVCGGHGGCLCQWSWLVWEWASLVQSEDIHLMDVPDCLAN